MGLKRLLLVLLFILGTGGVTSLCAQSASPSVYLSGVIGAFYPGSGVPPYSESVQINTAAAPYFTQAFPEINFNSPNNYFALVGLLPGSGDNGDVRPFTDFVVDSSGNAVDQIVASGNGWQAWQGPMGQSFQAVFTGNLVVDGPGQVTLAVYADDTEVLGVGGGANLVSSTDFFPADKVILYGSTPLKGYPVALDSHLGGKVVVSFPAAGTYPFELDYAENIYPPASLSLQYISSSGASMVVPGMSLAVGSAPAVCNGQDICSILRDFQTELGSLGSALSSETARAESAESALGSAIANETSRAKGVEAGLQTSVNNLNATKANLNGGNLFTGGQTIQQVDVPYSASPTLDASIGNNFRIVLSGNVTHSMLIKASAGQVLVLEVCQNTSGGWSFSFPSNVKGAAVPKKSASTCTPEMFYFDGTDAWYIR